MKDGDAPLPAGSDPVGVPDEQKVRQACESLAGHLYQAARAASEWVQLEDDARLLIEVAEDYATLAAGVLTMTQAKHEPAGRVTLSSDGVRKALVGLIAFQDENPQLSVRLNYLTTATPSRETAARLPEGVTGIDYWPQVVRGAEIEPLRELLIETQRDQKLLEFIRTASPDDLRRRLIEPVQWLTASDRIDQATKGLTARLRRLALDRGGLADDGERALPFILYRILQAAIAADRVLTRDDFEKEWARATTVSVSVSFLRKAGAALAGTETGFVALSSAPPPLTLPVRLAPRRALVDELLGVLREGDLLWLHGSSGLGKSHLARLIAARGNERWSFVSLKDQTDSERAARLREAIAGISREDFAGLILDDVPTPASEPVRHWLAAAAEEIAATARGKIVVTAEREALPQLRRAFEPLRLTSRDAPYLVESDVADIVEAAGGDAASWSTPVYLTCGTGHPLLVDARVAGLASRNWPSNERLEGLVPGSAPSEVVDVRRETILHLLNELAPDAHLLLMRVSALISPFDRAMALAVAGVEPAISGAGALFELLVGPWIEQIGEDRFKLTPLLMQAAVTALSDDERGAINGATVDGLIKRNPFPGDLLPGLALHSMIARHLGGFAFIARAVMMSGNRRAVAQHLVPLAFMSSGEDGLLVPENRGVSLVLRIAQLIVAVGLPRPTMVESIFKEALAENAAAPAEVQAANLYTIFISVLGDDAAQLPPQFWMPLLSDYRDLISSGSVPEEMIALSQSVDLGGLTQDQFFFVIRTNKISTVTELETLFDLLDNIDGGWRRLLLSAAPTLLGGPPLFVQMAWTRQGSEGTLDSAAAQTYGRLAAMAQGWGEQDVAIECFRSRAVILDEYVGDQEEALAALNEAEECYPGHQSLVRSRATVLGNMGRHAEELDLLRSIEDDYSAQEPLERIMMLRAAAISAGKQQKHEEAARLFGDAHSLCEAAEPVTLGASVVPGLLADSAIMSMLADQPRMALDRFRELLEHLDTFDGSDDPSLTFARGAADQAIQWASARIENRNTSVDLALNPGVCSQLRPDLDSNSDYAPDARRSWYLLARLEILTGEDAGVESLLDAREQRDGVDVKLAAGLATSQLAQSVARSDIDRFFALLPRFAALFGLVARFAQKPEQLDELGVSFRATPISGWNEQEANVGRATVAAFVGYLLLQDRPDEAAALAARAKRLGSHLENLLSESGSAPADLAAAGLSIITLLKSQPIWNAEELLGASAQLFHWIFHVGLDVLHAPSHGLLSAHWLDLARERRAILSNPRLAVPAIERAANEKPTVAALARLVLAGALGASRPLPPNVIAALEAVARRAE